MILTTIGVTENPENLFLWIDLNAIEYNNYINNYCYYMNTTFN